jgi:aldose 1-epimerase
MSNIIIEESVFGKLSEGQQVKRFLLKNKNDFSFSVISLGAAIQSINVKDRNNKLVNVVLGFETLEGKFF